MSLTMRETHPRNAKERAVDEIVSLNWLFYDLYCYVLLKIVFDCQRINSKRNENLSEYFVQPLNIS